MVKNTMEIKLQLNEMFAISRIVDKQPIIGYRAALSKFLHKMLDIKEFSEATAQYEEIKINESEILKEFVDQRQELSNKIKKTESNKITPELQEELNRLNVQITQKIQEKNRDLYSKINALLDDKSLIYNFQFDELLIKSITNIVESEQTTQDLGVEEPIIKLIIDVYIKLQEK